MFKVNLEIPYQELNYFFSKKSIFYQYICNFENVRFHYQYDYNNLSEIYKMLENHQIKIEQRKKLAKILTDYNLSFNDSPLTRKNLTLFKNENCFTVMTGQQCGLLTGPLYTIYKAISAILLAKKLSKIINFPVIPIFWAASEDHDFNEINQVNWLNNQGQFEKIKVKSDYNGRSIIDLEFEPIIIRNFLDKLPKSDFTQEVIDCFDFNEKSLSISFVKLLSHLFKFYGLLIVEPYLLRSFCGNLNLIAFDKRKEIKKAFDKYTQILKSKNYDITIKTDESLHLFYYDKGQRKKLYQKNDDKYKTKDDQFTINKIDLENQLVNNPELFSPDVVLRPIYQDKIFSNIAYVAGPNEINYFAQLKGVYEIFNQYMPIIYPRVSVSLLEKKNQKILKRFNWTINNIFTFNSKIKLDESDKKNMEDTKIIADFKQKINQTILNLMISVEEKGEIVSNGLKSSIKKIHFEVSKIEFKYLAGIENLKGMNKAQIEKLKNNIIPKLELQERIFNIFYYLNLYGFSMIDELIASIKISEFSHQVLFYE